MALMNATTAKSNIASSPNVIQELAVLTVAVANAIDANASQVIVNAASTVSINSTTITGSYMTAGASAATYYNVFVGTTEDAVKSAEMQAIIDYFTALGYGISRKSSNLTTFYWTISWT